MTSKETLFWNNKNVESMRNKLMTYEMDDKMKDRKETCECKYCTYINNGRIAGQAFTFKICANCGKELLFPTTDTDKYCLDCAKKLNVCKHCGSEMD